MLVRIEQGMTRSTDTERARSYRRRRQASWLKVWLVGFAGLGVLGLGGLAVAAGVKQLAPQRPPTVSVAPTSQASGTTPEPRASASATKPATQTPGSSPDASTPRHSASPTADGPIAARADVNARSSIYWEQNDLTIDAAQPLTALTVELRVVQSTGVQSTGSWRTAPPEDFTMSVTQSDGYLVYRWILKPGLTLPAARQVFAAQFNHGTGKRDASKDAFVVEATVAGRAVAVRGVFPSGG
jgi:cytoskeletal protein RodZ